jgi:small subunit ribosomal protein S5
MPEDITTETIPEELPLASAPEQAADADAVEGEAASSEEAAVAPAAARTMDRARRNPRRARRTGRREERVRPEFDQKIISIRRVTRVMAGGRRFSFSVAMVAGNKKGRVGVGIGKAGDTQLAIEKAFRNARKNMIDVPMDAEQNLPHDVTMKYAASQIMIRPAPGRGIVAGSSVRTVLELAGVKDVTAKVLSRSKNKLNNARAAIRALSSLRM